MLNVYVFLCRAQSKNTNVEYCYDGNWYEHGGRSGSISFQTHALHCMLISHGLLYMVISNGLHVTDVLFMHVTCKCTSFGSVTFIRTKYRTFVSLP